MPYCPPKYELYENIKCKSQCRNDFVELNNNYCVKKFCNQSTELIQDPNDISRCLKTNIIPITASDCPLNYTQWTVGECYKECPDGFLEDGIACIKQKITRQNIDAKCYWFTNLESNGCQLDYLLLSSFIFFFILIFVIVYNHKQILLLLKKDEKPMYNRYVSIGTGI